MPIFEFQCESCSKEFEELVSSPAAAKDVVCPACGKRKATRKISVFAAQSGGKPSEPSGFGSGCGRCGNPAGPCGL